MSAEAFYERFWADASYSERYALDSARRDRFPAILAVWGDRPPPRRVLDFGCGNGVLTAWMRDHGFGEEIVGVDVSRTAIAFARERFARPGLAFHTLDEIALDALGRFDAVVSSHVLEHLDDPLAELRRLKPLAPELLLEAPLEDCLYQRLNWRVTGRDPKANPVGHVQFWTRAGFRGLIERAGLRIAAERRYASAPFSPFTRPAKRAVERAALALLGVEAYGALMATHYIVRAV